MGSYNVTCSLSRISISGGDRCAIVGAVAERVLNNGQSGDFVIPPSSMFIESEGFGLAAVSIPIWGEYNDYGEIEVDDNPKHEALIQQKYGCSLQEFANCVTRPFDDRKDWPIKLAKAFPDGMFCLFFSEEAFQGAVEYMRENHSADKEAQVDDVMLDMLGFVEEKSITSPDKRYNRVFMRPKVKSYCVLSDGRWGNIYKLNKKNDGYNFVKAKASTYHPDTFMTAWSILTGEHISEGWGLGGMLESEMTVLKYANKYSEYETIYQEAIGRGESESTARQLARLMTGRFDNARRMWGGYNTSHIAELYEPALRKKDEDIMREIAEYKSVRTFMYLVQAMFLPAVSGPQCGDYEATQELGQIISTISRNKIIERRY